MGPPSKPRPRPLVEGVTERLREPSSGLARYREILKQGARAMRERFDLGEPAETLVRARAQLIDEILTAAWGSHLDMTTGIALVAVGGYGRGELHPASDIDLMILLESEDEDTAERTGTLLTFFWDIGLEVGHSVRTLGQCVEEASKDITVATNLMEARFLTGDRELFEAMRAATAPDRIWPSDEFFAAKCEEQRARYQKFGDTSYNLEPNIKEGPGGLRDIQVIGWVAKRHYGAETMFGLVEHGFLTEKEYGSLMEGQQLLWCIRFALHLFTGRREDRLLFDYQRTLAGEFGYLDQDNNLAVEQFMQRYYRTIMELNRLNEMLLQHFQEAIILHTESCDPEPINPRFHSCSGYLEAVDERVFRRQSFALLELFLVMAQHPELKGVRASTIRQIRAHRHLIDDKFRNDLSNRALFMEILRQPRGITHELRRMNRYGVLAAYIPLFENIVGRMQYDLFHIFTVDEHTLFVVRNLRRFFSPDHRHEFPLCSDIIRSIPKPELLYLAGLFHDIAKGRGGDHSELGALDAADFCRHHQLSNHDSNLVAWLVRQHLLMSLTVQRKDISDPEVIQEFADKVADLNRLDYLFLLTVADNHATNPKRWSNWKYTLLSELYGAARRALQRGLENPQAQDEVIEEQRKQALEELKQQGDIPPSQIAALWSSIAPDYFLHNQPERIARQTAAVLATTPEHLPLVTIMGATVRGCSEIFVYSPRRKGIFANSTGMLDRLGLNIVDARIQTTTDGYTLNSYLVLEEDGQPIADLRRKEEVIETLRHGIEHPEVVNLQATRRLARQLRHFEIGTRIDITRDIHHERSILRITTSDRPGLLARISLALSDCDIRLLNAKIATLGEMAEDIFFIGSRDGGGYLDEPLAERLKAALRKRLEA
ncbi:MAG: [protein-PII] uridylyltransferase [Gammaproteobacteria bacterium]|nr:[protein-PII] uridylyltransferase [Gammaproteobacteria bacterium]MBU1656105.1 [protein-PII] uridylyltransferase [Gammaproteobacteria bacterium]MBU1962190.1 [protein-PII] uridylyltransferase [Gammaproteobacteria bacterium]